ncbi:MAG: RagB/SusD family nutrient uptake outer membrane protein [Mediterranea sp.]|jgi:hypothetical protein|nr:RagB/SusD family nutrient uptake outer membrane protein [Mediterranea sp.]
MKKYGYTLFVSLVLLMGTLLASCSDFLSKVPDSRTEVTLDNVNKLLLSAYPTTAFCQIGELSSDNTDAYPSNFSSFNRLQEDTYKWADTGQNNEDSPSTIWESCYMAVASCNMALATIEEAGNPAYLDAVRGEALVCRAYAHFLLSNVFCKAYSSTANADLGMHYMKTVETVVSPHYERGTLEDLYKNIESDLLEGMPLLSDNVYAVPKYHFTKRAAYAFAARFYLYYVKADKSNYDKVIEYAGKILGDNPALVVRDWRALGALGENGNVQPNAYVDVGNDANILLVSASSYWGYVHGPTDLGERYSHGPMVISETCSSVGPWGNGYYMKPWSNASSLPTKYILRKVGEYTEVVDAIAGTINGHILNAAFTTDEILLCRAEAYIMKGSAFYPQALADLNIWQTAFTSTNTALTVASINDFYGNLAYYKPLEPTVKKELHPDFAIEDGTQENLIHCLLHARRLTTLHEGLRWQDIKRYGIVIYRRSLSNSGAISVTDELKVDDPRRAIQLPSDVISAGAQPNPRNK